MTSCFDPIQLCMLYKVGFYLYKLSASLILSANYNQLHGHEFSFNFVQACLAI